MLRIMCAMMLVMVAQGKKRQDKSTAIVEECGTAVESNGSRGVCDDVSDKAKYTRNKCCHLQGTTQEGGNQGKDEASCLDPKNTKCEQFGGCFMVDRSVQSGKTGPMCKPACDAQTFLKNDEDKAEFLADWGDRLEAHEKEETPTTRKIHWKTIKMVLGMIRPSDSKPDTDVASEEEEEEQSTSPVPRTEEDKKFDSEPDTDAEAIGPPPADRGICDGQQPCGNLEEHSLAFNSKSSCEASCNDIYTSTLKRTLPQGHTCYTRQEVKNCVCCAECTDNTQGKGCDSFRKGGEVYTGPSKAFALSSPRQQNTTQA